LRDPHIALLVNSTKYLPTIKVYRWMTCLLSCYQDQEFLQRRCVEHLGWSKDDVSRFALLEICADRCLGSHESLKRQAIMMPAMSPLMTEGTITRWKIKEGDAFAPGDVLLQIVTGFTTYFMVQSNWLHLQESEIATIDVEAHNPGILGRILVSFFSTCKLLPE
jgi:hypothetical protein